ncbi:MAG: nucleotide exchange factor GrpE [Minisyncoccia bacterium]
MTKEKQQDNKQTDSADLVDKLNECEKLKNEYLAGWQRARADFLNYKKEEMERIAQLLKYANEEFILNLLPILDNFDLAEKKLPEELKKNESVKGLLQIYQQLKDWLKKQGVEEIVSVGEIFNPSWHEVVGEVAAENAANKQIGLIVEEIQKGYKINGHLLRPAKVKVVK